MTLGATRHFESSFQITEWFLDEQREAVKIYRDLLVETSEDIWDVSPPRLPEKNDD